MIKFLDFFRIVAVCATIFFGYYIGYSGTTYDPVSQLHFMIPLVIIIVAGLSGLEGLLWGDKAAGELSQRSRFCLSFSSFSLVLLSIMQ